VKLLLAIPVLMAGAALQAQTAPQPSADDPRLQTLVEQAGQPSRLVALPATPLTLIMRRGEQVERVVLSDSSAFRIVVTGNNDSLSITPLRPGAVAQMQVEGSGGTHQFLLETGRGLAAAYVVRMVEGAPEQASLVDGGTPAAHDFAAMAGHYRLAGDRTLRPAEIGDDGTKTYIAWGREQSIPAVLGIGPTGEEEVVAGFMRNDVFTIDRVYSELVLRIDKHKMVAIRESQGKRR